MRAHPLATAAIAIAASIAVLLAAALAGSTGLVTALAIVVVMPVSAILAGRFLLGAGAASGSQQAVPGGAPQMNAPERDDTSSILTMLAGFVAAGMIVVGGGVVGLAMHGSLDHDPMMGSAPMAQVEGHMAFMLDEVPAEVATHYRFAASNRDLYSMIPCFCGCEATLDHRNLHDCFVRPGGGWESHASGCAICIDESKMARRLQASGEQPEAIRDAIVARYEALIPG